MDQKLPGLVVTGASGFVGRNFLASAAGRYRLFCLARRSQREARIPAYEHLHWTQVDVARWDTLKDVVAEIKQLGGASYILHLAGYYDFKMMEHPEYERTNVQGTRNVLQLARELEVSRFLFASSLAACAFPDPGRVIDEESPPDAPFAYARSKRDGEDMVREHTEWFAASVLRFAAVYSDWCEYPPLYVFLRTWLSEIWNARVLGGRGDSAVTYIHVQDLVRLIHIVLDRSDDLPRYAIYNASPSHTTSHLELFAAATRFFYGDGAEAVHMPRLMCEVGVRLRWWLGKLRGSPPFEAPWMTQYIDQQLRVDSSRTQAALNWRPTPRLDVTRRLLVLTENMKSHGDVWHERNEAALRRIANRPNLTLADALEDDRKALVAQLLAYVREPAQAERFRVYQAMDPEALGWFVTLILEVLRTAVRTRDRQLLRRYAQVIAARRRQEGFTCEEVVDFVTTVGRVVTASLRARPDLVGMEQQIHDHITLGFQLAADGVEDVFEATETLRVEADAAGVAGITIPTSSAMLEHFVHELQDIGGEPLTVFAPGSERVGP
jgi:nucleoside-diphosphate-sugar epimerase